PQARLLDPRERVAARRARAVRARDPLVRDAPPPGLLPPRRRAATPRRARLRRRGSQPPHLGAARVHAVVRAPRRAGAAASPLRAHGGAARVRVWIDMTASA